MVKLSTETMLFLMTKQVTKQANLAVLTKILATSKVPLIRVPIKVAPTIKSSLSNLSGNNLGQFVDSPLHPSYAAVLKGGAINKIIKDGDPRSLALIRNSTPKQKEYFNKIIQVHERELEARATKNDNKILDKDWAAFKPVLFNTHQSPSVVLGQSNLINRAVGDEAFLAKMMSDDSRPGGAIQRYIRQYVPGWTYGETTVPGAIRRFISQKWRENGEAFINSLNAKK